VIFFAPTEKGVILVRAAIGADKDIPALKALLGRARCETVASSPGLR
jgi:uncharacterized membrane protein